MVMKMQPLISVTFGPYKNYTASDSVDILTFQYCVHIPLLLFYFCLYEVS